MILVKKEKIVDTYAPRTSFRGILQVLKQFTKNGSNILRDK